MTHYRALTLLLSRLPVTLSLLLFVTPACLYGEVLVHETFANNDISDDSPAVWEGSCVDPWGSCGAASEIVVRDGQADVTFNSFNAWSLTSVEGEEIEPGNTWSIRARVTGQPGENNIVGVGIDSYYWGAALYQGGLAGLAAGDPQSNSGGDIRHSFFEPWIVQLDVYPDRLEAFRWPADDPSNVASTTWTNGSPIEPGRPTFWGHWGGNSVFDEVIVATSPMGVGGDFDLSGSLDLADLTSLNGAIQAGENDPRFNLTGDEIVDQQDMDVWLSQLKNTFYGDADLDGTVGFGDFLVLSANFGAPGDWSQGDFDGNGEIQFPDFLVLSHNFGSSVNVTAVPEPSAITCLLIGLVAAPAIRRRR